VIVILVVELVSKKEINYYRVTISGEVTLMLTLLGRHDIRPRLRMASLLNTVHPIRGRGRSVVSHLTRSLSEADDGRRERILT
jgi:hypothetical protein